MRELFEELASLKIEKYFDLEERDEMFSILLGDVGNIYNSFEKKHFDSNEYDKMEMSIISIQKTMHEVISVEGNILDAQWERYKGSILSNLEVINNIISGPPLEKEQKKIVLKNF